MSVAADADELSALHAKVDELALAMFEALRSLPVTESGSTPESEPEPEPEPARSKVPPRPFDTVVDIPSCAVD